MRVTSLGSGSSGNAYLVEAGPEGRTRLLIDAGFSLNVLTERLRQLGCTPRQLSGVLITHEHSDHVYGLQPLMRRYSIPAIADPRTLTALKTGFSTGATFNETGRVVRLEIENTAPDGSVASNILSPSPEKDRLWQPLPAGMSSVIGDIAVNSFAVSHDCVAPCGYLLSAGGCRVCLVTDTGEVTANMLEPMARADLLILESNHDRQRLLSGPYPFELKQRILSPVGHLSNEQAAAAVLQTWRSDGLRWLWLAHLSKTNNTHKLALSSMQSTLRTAGANLNQIHISTLKPGLSSTWDSTRLWHDPTLWDLS
jgi:phosphoribosyl 1,2-cyclic phosphodiesterase